MTSTIFKDDQSISLKRGMIYQTYDVETSSIRIAETRYRLCDLDQVVLEACAARSCDEVRTCSPLRRQIQVRAVTEQLVDIEVLQIRQIRHQVIEPGNIVHTLPFIPIRVRPSTILDAKGR